jgi:hypothetical protein
VLGRSFELSSKPYSFSSAAILFQLKSLAFGLGCGFVAGVQSLLQAHILVSSKGKEATGKDG